MKRRILIVAEAVTLAHIARPLALARIFEQLGHEVILACSPSAAHWVEAEGRSFVPIESITQQQFLHALRMGRPLYDSSTLERYVEADLALMESVRPDVVIGDFRLSLWISTKLAKLPYGNVTNAYWAPRYFRYSGVPDIPLTRAIGVTLADIIFRLVHRRAFAWHSLGFAAAARRFGVKAASDGLLGAYTASDCTAYADLNELYAAPPCPSPREIFIGPLAWSPRFPLPQGHERWGANRPLVYIALGSSGPPDVLEKVLAALAELAVDAVVATAGAKVARSPKNAQLFDYLPGQSMCKRSSLVIGNGGSPSTYQALAAGRPVIGLASNLDQFLNMRRVEEAGAGICIRADSIEIGRLQSHCREMIHLRDWGGGWAEKVKHAEGALPSSVAAWLGGLVSQG